MINQVNKAPIIPLSTSQPKHSEHDPGSSQGSGMFYDGPILEKEKEATSPTEDAEEQENETEENPDPKTRKLSLVKKEKPIKINSLNLVYEEFCKKKEDSASIGITTQYTTDSVPAKGMLLNKKAV